MDKINLDKNKFNNIVFFPKFKKTIKRDNNICEKIGGRTFLTLDEATNFPIHWKFVMQIFDPMHKNILLRIFWSDIKFNFRCLPFDIKKNPDPNKELYRYVFVDSEPTFPCWSIIGWTKTYELKQFDELYKLFNKNISSEKFRQIYSSHARRPSFKIKLFGTPMSAQDANVSKYNLLQISGGDKYIPLFFGDSGIGHVMPNKYETYFDCY